MKAWIVRHLERLCDATHFITNHRPYLWALPHCPFARLSAWLDERWQTGEWETGT